MTTAAVSFVDAAADQPPAKPLGDRPDTNAFDHRVTFYESDDSLYAVVADFFREGLAVNEPLVVVATELHRHGFIEHLKARGFDPAALCAAGQLTLIDARDTLSTFLVDDMPDPKRFEATARAILERARNGGVSHRVRVYGEMVNLLWCDGNPQATIRLEGLWNEMGHEGSLSLLCGYLLGNFNTGKCGEPFQHICGSHTRVVPTEGEGDIVIERSHASETGLGQVDLLRGEIEHRKRLEQALHEALAHRRRAEDALRASQEELQRQNEELSRTVRFSELFVGILGHDLRNPLSAITTAASLLRKRADSDKVAKPASRILSSAGRMGRMIDQVLDFTRIRLGKGIPVQPRATDLVQVCRTAIDELEGTGHVRNVDLSWDGDCVGLWDTDRLLQLISNLVGNALTHGTPAQAVGLRVDGTDPQTVFVEVRNAGSVPPEVMAVMFEPFGKGSYARGERPSGLGLGLFIGQQIVSMHLGTIEVTSSEVEGTRFVVRLPRSSDRLQPAFVAAGD